MSRGHSRPRIVCRTSTPLVVEIRDGSGQPVARVPVEWSATTGTSLPMARVTDSLGRASAEWTIGATPGKYTATATIGRGASVEFAAWVDSPPPSSLSALTVESYDGSGQTVHPHHVTLPAPVAIASGDRHWRSPRACSSLLHIPAETPASRIRRSSRARTACTGRRREEWPIRSPAPGYLSDPDALYDPESSEIWLYYRQVTEKNLIWLIRSSDGTRWSEPALVVSARNHQIISPTVVRRGEGDWLMWAVNAGADG